MRVHMPRRFLNSLLPASAIAPLLRDADVRMTSMENDQNNGSTAASYLPAGRTLPTLKNAASECRGCELYADATQTVFGQGPPTRLQSSPMR